MNELELIRRAKRGDEQAIEALYRRHSGRVYTLIRRVTGNDEEAEDVAQEAWLKVIRSLPTFRGDSLFSTWVHRIAVNAALYSRRRGKNQALGCEMPEALVDETPRTEPVLRMKLERALDLLPDGMRRVLVLHDVEGYTHEEIAELLGVTAGTCKSQLFKARAKMRAVLRPKIEIEGEEVCSI